MDWLKRLRPARLDAATRAFVAWCVSEIAPNLAHARGYPQRFAPALLAARAYCDALAQTLPAPMLLARSAFVVQPQVRALFATAAAIPAALTQSVAVRDWFAGHDADTIHALMGVRLHRRQVFGLAIQGDAVQREVAQEVASFADHTFTALAADARALRTEIARELMFSLLTQARARVETLVAIQQALTEEKQVLQADLRARPDAARQQRLAQCLHELHAAHAALDAESVWQHVEPLLSDPAAHLGLHPHAFGIDDTGVCHVDAAQTLRTRITLCELRGRDRRHWMVMPVCIPRAELESAPGYAARLAEAGRWLTI